MCRTNTWRKRPETGTHVVEIVRGALTYTLMIIELYLFHNDKLIYGNRAGALLGDFGPARGE